MWLADRSGGFHFDYDEDSGKWVCEKSEELLGEMLERIVWERAGEKLDFDEI
ncbi:frataxin domain-containing protein [Klebsiella pneumoniae]|uniref:frataxin domain-containing protein n=1 Tax=Klebsiella pneumoniae TaxID=573 RepID=UPI001D0DEAB3